MMKDSGKILYDESPLVVNPELAKLIGINEAIILQQVHYWLVINEKADHNIQDGYYWTYNTYEQWHEQFPFWSKNTIIRAIQRLEKNGFLISANYNKMTQDKTKWYRIDYEALPILSSPSTHTGKSKKPKRVASVSKMSTALPETTTETTTKTSTEKRSSGEFKNVFLTDNELSKLIERFGPARTIELVNQLSAGIESKGYKYKSHYATILNWDRRDNGSKPEGRNAGVNNINSDDPNKYIKGKYGHMVRR